MSADVKEAFLRFDAMNAEDPNRETVDGEEHPKELLYAQRMSERLARFAPDASVVLQLAARAQHLERWRIARSEYPMDRPGYLRWRQELKKLHASRAAEVLEKLGFDDAQIARVQSLLMKKALKTDPEVQCLEDVVCLVFLEHYWSAFMAKHDDEKLINIVRKTWAKMSEKGHAAALELPFDERSLAIVKAAVAS